MTNVTNFGTAEISNLSPTIQDYLAFIYVMERDKEPVVGSRLAELLGVTAPTVTNTLKRMARDGLLVKTLPWSKLHSEAHHLEHAISTMTETALMEQLGHPQTCPHGNPLPGCEEAVAAWVPLINAAVGETVIIRRIHELTEENAQLLGYLETKHILPGERVSVTEVLPFNQTITIEAEGQSVTLGNSVARYLFVERGTF
jgi:DtxR family Mn-dependent transcriptional regulator